MCVPNREKIDDDAFKHPGHSQLRKKGKQVRVSVSLRRVIQLSHQSRQQLLLIVDGAPKHFNARVGFLALKSVTR
jgi:hypothetical protein